MHVTIMGSVLNHTFNALVMTLPCVLVIMFILILADVIRWWNLLLAFVVVFSILLTFEFHLITITSPITIDWSR